jgi:uncharacterized membrane protein YraQ (UPF0718 family)
MSTCDHGHHEHDHHHHEHDVVLDHAHHTPGATLFGDVVASLREQAPWLVIGLLLAAALTLLPSVTDRIVSVLSPKRRFAPLVAAAVGISVPICSCGALPVAALLASRGVDAGAVVAFLIASQAAGLDSAITTWSLIGANATVLRLVNALVAATVCGAVASMFSVAPTVNAKTDKKKQKADETDEAPTSFLGQLVSLFASVAPWVVVGEVSSQLLSPYVTEYVDGSASRLLLFAIILPVQLCEHATAALVHSISKAFGSHGVGAAMLILAPAVNITTLSFLSNTVGVNPALIAATLIGWAMATSSLIDWLDISALANQASTSHAHGDEFPPAVQTASEVAVVVLSLLALQRVVATRPLFGLV